MPAIESDLQKRPLVCGHRGASGYAPENTLTAFRRARELGATWIEFDVQLSADGVPIILHDDTLKRTTNLGKPLRPTELNLAELKKLDAGSWFGPEFAGEPIATLDEVLEEFGTILGLNIEIKSKAHVQLDPLVEKKVAKAVRHYKLQDKVIISSFGLMSLPEIDPELRLGVLYNDKVHEYPPNFDPIARALSYKAVAIHPSHKVVNSSLVKRAAENGLAVNTWTANSRAEMRRLVDLGVDMIITNYPDRLGSLLQTTG